MFCKSCGKQIDDNISFCAYCGTPTGVSPQPDPTQQAAPEAPVPPIPFQQRPTAPQAAPHAPMMPPAGYQPPAPQYAPQQNYAPPYAPQGAMIMPRKKVNIPLLIIIIVVVVGLIGTGVFLIFRPKADGGGSALDSSIVSKGVNTDDLGNIINGQYFFDDGTNQYYASFDTNNAAHIYKTTKGSSTATPIFDGFGWSLVVNDGWLYFSGNQGTVIDGTYNLFRMKTDGTELETLNTGFCYGMNIYKDYMYFVRRPSVDSDESYIYRSDLDGKNETVIATGTIYNFIVYDTKLYYLDSSYDLYCAKDDGTDAKVISTDSIGLFIIGNGKIIYATSEGAICHMNIDGTEITEVAPAGAMPIYSLNSYKGNIFYTEYNANSGLSGYAQNYYLHKINFDGSNNVQVYIGISYGTYINIIDGKPFVLDYAENSTTGTMTAIAKNMELDGQNVQELFR